MPAFLAACRFQPLGEDEFLDGPEPRPWAITATTVFDESYLQAYLVQVVPEWMLQCKASDISREHKDTWWRILSAKVKLPYPMLVSKEGLEANWIVRELGYFETLEEAANYFIHPAKNHEVVEAWAQGKALTNRHISTDGRKFWYEGTEIYPGEPCYKEAHKIYSQRLVEARNVFGPSPRHNP